MNDTKQQFFALLRSGLWGTEIEPLLFAGAVDWSGIFSMAQKQTVTGLLFDGVSKLPVEVQPSAEMMRRMFQMVVRIERSHQLLNKKLSEIVPAMRAESICPILLKGQGVAQNYLNPLRRQCGDIDLYVGKENCDKAMKVLLDLGADAQNKTKRKSPKHENFDYDGVSVELHFLVEKLYYPKYNKRFQMWTKQQLCADKLRVRDIGGETEVLLPPVDFDALFVFNHAYRHFLSGGIGLRQLCDWAMHLHVFAGQINKEELLDGLKSFGIFKAWQVFGCIAVDYLGLPKDEFPFYTAKYAKHSDKLLREILFSGNFGQYNPELKKRPKGYLRGKLHSLFIRNKRLSDMLTVFPKDVLVYYIYSWCDGINSIRKGW